MAKAKPKQGAFTRVNTLIAEAVLIELAEVQVGLRKRGVNVSQSAMIEVAIKEFVNRHDIEALLKKYGARKKRG